MLFVAILFFINLVAYVFFWSKAYEVSYRKGVEFWLMVMLPVVFMAMPLYSVLYLASEKEVVINVKEVTIKRGWKYDRYLVKTDNEIFECTDSYVFMKFNSSDIALLYLEKGDRYRVSVAGWRIRFFSCYRNIIEIIERQNR